MKQLSEIIKRLPASLPTETIESLKNGEPEWPPEEQLIKRLGLYNLDHTFENYKCPPGDKKSKEAFELLAYGKTSKPWVFCYGGVGNGKTHLVMACLLELSQRGLYGRYQTVSDLLDVLKFHIDPPPGFSTLYDFEQKVMKSDVLVLDDLGVEYPTDWTRERLHTIIDYRYRNQLITVVATNVDRDVLIKEFKYERIISRLRDSNVCQMVCNEAEDYRRRTAKKGQIDA